MLRGTLYLATMTGVIVVIGVVINIICALLGIQLAQAQLTTILIISAVAGFAGSIISLLLSKSLCKRSQHVQVITTPRSEAEQWLVQTVAKLAKAKGVDMPEVGIYPAAEANAFATGWNKNAALVAVSSGILKSMNRRQLEAVLGHEMSHVSNGDMVTQTLIQGIVNTFVYALSYILAAVASSALSGGRSSDDRSSSGGGLGNMMVYYMINSVLQALFGFLGSLVCLWFSRWREYRADAGSAECCGKEAMISALQVLGGLTPASDKTASMQALCINGSFNLSELFSTHPTIEKRIAALRAL